MGTTGRAHEDQKQTERGTGSWERHLLPEGHTRRGLGGLERPEEPRCGWGQPLPPAPPLHWLIDGVSSPPLAPQETILGISEEQKRAEAGLPGSRLGHPWWADPAGKHCTGPQPCLGLAFSICSRSPNASRFLNEPSPLGRSPPVPQGRGCRKARGQGPSFPPPQKNHEGERGLISHPQKQSRGEEGQGERLCVV